MNKKLLILPLLVISALAGCNSQEAFEPEIINLDFDSNETFDESVTKGALTEFNLLTPIQNNVLSETPTFTWEASQNAITYTLEVCNYESFEHESADAVYAKETNISSTQFTLSSPLKLKNTMYYWRVTAVNNLNNNSTGKTKECNEVFKFFYESQNVDEINVDLGEEGDWQLHKEGSKATIGIDHSNFFGSGSNDSLTISFEKEDTNRGVPSSDGWIVVTKVLEQDFYGTDSILFNFYYSGNDADVLIRFMDTDGEYWYNKIKVSQNAKQTVLMRFDEFTLRTKDTIVQNQIFNYEHMQYIEVVFEKTFGDGVCVLGNVRAVNHDSYSYLFLDKINFNTFTDKPWIVESYDFKREISDDGSELKLSYSNNPGYNGNEKGMNDYGFGFAKIPIERYFASGNAIKVKMKYDGYASSAKMVIRIYEEDEDRWSYEQPLSALTKNEYLELAIPFVAFAKSEIRADGNRQFYYIKQIQFGVSGVYGTGCVYFKDIEIVNLPSVNENKKNVGEDGIIEDFDSYSNRTEVYRHWESSVENKDESIFLSADDKFNNGINKYAGQFNYKSDMGMATYDSYLDVSYEGGNALKFWIKDGSSLKSGDSNIEYLTVSDISPLVVIQLALKDGRWYRYTIEKAPRYWTEYIIKFADFELYSGVETELSIPFSSENVVNLAFGMQYFYYTRDGKSHPVYSESNPVYFDSFMFVNSNETKNRVIENVLKPETSNPSITHLDDFEYLSEEELRNNWFGLKGFDYENISLSDEVSSSGGSHSMKLDYKTNGDSPSYAIYPTFSDDVTAKAIQFDIMSPRTATIYLNFYIRNGSNYYQYRHTIHTSSTSWTRYIVGFSDSYFDRTVSGNSPLLNVNSIRSLHHLTFGMTSYSGSGVSSIYVDNILFNSDVNTSVYSENVIS